MVPNLAFGVGEFTLADIGNLAVPTLECPMAFSSAGSLTALKARGLRLRPFFNNRVHDDFKQCGRASAAPPSSQGRGFGGGKFR